MIVLKRIMKEPSSTPPSSLLLCSEESEGLFVAKLVVVIQKNARMHASLA